MIAMLMAKEDYSVTLDLGRKRGEPIQLLTGGKIYECEMRSTTYYRVKSDAGNHLTNRSDSTP